MIPQTSFLSDARRAWLNGFCTGFLGIEPTLVSDEALAAAGLTKESVILPPAPDEEEFPWHQPDLPIEKRLTLAENKPLNRKLMAAMAQLDCGSCGYDCRRYSEAIAAGQESDLSLCSPGGKETKKTLKKILKQHGGVTATRKQSVATKNVANATGQSSRRNPFAATLLESNPLNAQGSAKDTRHIIIDLQGSDLRYAVGDALGVWPMNCRDLVHAILKHVGGEVDEVVRTPLGNSKPLVRALCEDCCLKDPSDELLEYLLNKTVDEAAKSQLKSLLDDGAPEGFDVLDALQIDSSVCLSSGELVASLESIKPRLYSISSSMKSVGQKVHLTVGTVRYERAGRLRRGVASTLLAERLDAGERVPVFVHPNQSGFTTPSDGSLPMIMIGPGTGIAPFIAFLQEREATRASGKNWLFFGDQHQACDFLYESELQRWQDSGLLTRLSTAFSRDGKDKLYVQDRMRQHGKELWQWITEGASVFVCGDATRMAADVDQQLVLLCQRHGQMSPSDATDFVARLSEKKRYVRDVY